MFHRLHMILGRSGRAAVVWTVLLTWLSAPLSPALRPSWAAFVDVTPTHLPPLQLPTSRLVLGDIDGDGALDVVVVSAAILILALNWYQATIVAQGPGA